MNVLNEPRATRRALWAVALAVLVVMPSGYCAAETLTYSFEGLTANNVANVATGEAQLSVEVSNEGVGSNQVKFTFRNAGPKASSITDVYFDDGALLSGIASFSESSGVEFSPGAAPGNLPGGNNAKPPFKASAGLKADSDPPVQPNGVNPGEWLAITFNLKSGMTFQSVLDALELGLHLNPNIPADDQGVNLRIGVHVQGFQGGGSESFLNGPPGVVAPEPSTLALALTGIAGLGYAGLRRFRHRHGSQRKGGRAADVTG